MANLYSRMLTPKVNNGDFARVERLTDIHNYLSDIAANFGGSLGAVDPTELVQAYDAFDVRMMHSGGESVLNIQGWTNRTDGSLEKDGPYLGQLLSDDPLTRIDGIGKLEHVAGLRRAGGVFELEIIYVDPAASTAELRHGYDVDSLTDQSLFFNPGIRKIVVE